MLVALVATLIARPWLPTAIFGIPRLRLLIALNLLAGVYVASQKLRLLRVAAALALSALLVEWIGGMYNARAIQVAHLVLAAFALAFVAGVILQAVLREQRITLDTIFGGVCIYLLIGLVWASFYWIAELLEPGSFLMGGVSVTEINRDAVEATRHPQLTYFSFVTLTTLGFGDVVPATDAVQGLVVTEAVLGQLFVAIFIARLVSLHIVHSRPEGG
jgi:hypothetical protein